MKIRVRPNHKEQHWEVNVTFGPEDKNQAFYLIESTLSVPSHVVIARLMGANPNAEVILEVTE